MVFKIKYEYSWKNIQIEYFISKIFVGFSKKNGEKSTMKKGKIIKKAIVLCMGLTMCLVSGIHSNADNQVKLPKPKLIPAGTTIVQPKGMDFFEKISSENKDSTIYYAVDNKSLKEEGKTYTGPIPINPFKSFRSIKAVNTKEGYQDSDVVERNYIAACYVPMVPEKGIKVNKIKKGTKKIQGSLKMDYTSKKYKLARYVEVTVKRSKKSASVYHGKVVKGKWSIKLKSALKKGNEITVDVYTKDCIVCFVKQRNYGKNAISVYSYSPNWRSVVKKIK